MHCRLLMAAYPRMPTSVTDNRCHLQAFRHLYALAARHRCVEAVEVETKLPVNVRVALETSEGTESTVFPRLLLPSNEVHAIRVQSEHFWPVTIERSSKGADAAENRWMKALQTTRRFYVKRRDGQENRSDSMGLDAAKAWFPNFTAPQMHHLERLLQAKGKSSPPPLGGMMLSWLQGRSSDGGALGAERTVNATEWAAVLCFEPAPALPPDTCLADFDDEDGTLVERFARLLVEPGGGNPAKPLRDLPLHALLAQELHQCVVESKVANFSWFVLLHLQGRAASEGRHAGLIHTPATPLGSKLAADHLLATLGFYQDIRERLGSRHEPLLPEDFMIERRREMR